MCAGMRKRQSFALQARPQEPGQEGIPFPAPYTHKYLAWSSHSNVRTHMRPKRKRHQSSAQKVTQVPLPRRMQACSKCNATQPQRGKHRQTALLQTPTVAVLARPAEQRHSCRHGISAPAAGTTAGEDNPTNNPTERTLHHCIGLAVLLTKSPTSALQTVCPGPEIWRPGPCWCIGMHRHKRRLQRANCR
jgi:hypothetical protein